MIGCDICDGSGIMWLYGGPGNNIKAPCLECSADRNLEDLEDEVEKAEIAKIRAEEQKEIEIHNQRIQGL